jgi:formiminotetrahydrofolate cyclodeaminase
MTVTQLLDALASPDPTPGGGTAAAITGAMGASLLMMVAGLARSKSNTDDEKAALAGAKASLQPAVARFAVLADADSSAFDQVMAAYRLPKTTDGDKTARTAAIQQALQGATVVPLDTLRLCVEVLTLARPVAEFGARSAVSDAGVAIGLLEAAAAGAEANVRINVASLRDERFREATADETGVLAASAAKLSAEARARLI